MIQVVNRRTYRGVSVYIGRPTILGNPFVIGKDGTREEVLQKYRRGLWRAMQSGNERVMAELKRLATIASESDLILSCWCAPEPCHGEIIRAAIEYLRGQAEASIVSPK